MFHAIPLLILLILQGFGTQQVAPSNLEARLRLQERIVAKYIRQERENRDVTGSVEESDESISFRDLPATQRECAKLKQSGFATCLRSRDGPTC